MSNPSFENIDQWLFEYMEGNLSPTQVTQLEMFLLNNPEYEADLDAWQYAKVDATPVAYPGKIGRKRKPIPFWVSATAALTVVFVAGGLLGAYVSSPDLVSSENVNPSSAAIRMEHRLIALNSIETEAYLADAKDGNSDANGTYDFNKQNDSKYSARTSRSVSGQSNKSNTLLNNSTSAMAFDAEMNKNKKAKTSAKDNFVAENPDALKSDLSRRESSVPKSSSDVIKEGEGVAMANREGEKTGGKKIDPSATAEAMTRGGNRIASNYNSSFSNKVKSTMRKIIRMTDNPVALTNSKDIYYHVPGMQTLNVNAATAGNLLRPRFQSISRAQWTGHSNQQLLNELSFDTYVRSIRGGIGVQLNHAYYNDGTYNVGQIALTYSPKLTVNRNFSIEPAIRLKMGDKRLNALNLVPGQIIEMERGNEKIFFNETPENVVKDLWYKDVALALNSNTKWFSAGIQVDNIGRHRNNVYNSKDQNDRAGMHYTANLGTDFVSRTKIISFSPYIMCQKVENLSEIWGGSIFRYKNLTVGGAYSSTGDYVGSIGVKTNRFMITYNADMTTSVLTDSRLFSQQVTMRILMNKGRYGRTMLKQ